MPVHSTSPIIVVSNRLPFILARSPDGSLVRKQCAGGLVTAVAPVVVESGGLWVGWPGLHLEDKMEAIPEADPNDKTPTAGLKSEQIIAVNIQYKLFSDYYNGCCNATFWPLFHSMPDRALFEADKWEAYRHVNEIFAQLTIQAIHKLKEKCPNQIPLVWLHDYHLMLAANYIRAACNEENLPIKLAFFLHIPFPSWDIVRLFPWDDELLLGILGCDSVGFHIEDYCMNFIDCCQRRLGCRIDRASMLVLHNLRTVSVQPLPISIPYQRFVSLAMEAPVVVKNKEEWQLILGIDRLDYTKGIKHRIKAFELLLEKYPEHREHVTLLQVAVPSRTDVKEYQELKEELDQLIGCINGNFSTPNWAPIRYIFGCVPQDQLAGFYRDSSVALVTALRDGMNLVAKEYVACQTKEPGVLILSPFAGASTTMYEALLVNPYEINSFADTIHRALTMPKDEREMRMLKLQKRESDRDVEFWFKSFLRTVDCYAGGSRTPGKLDPITDDFFSQVLSSYVMLSARLALLLDYDGTLAPIASHPDLGIMTDETKRLLERLANMPDVHVAIISGRSLQNIKHMVAIEGITYAGNHGYQILHPDGSEYEHPIPNDYKLKLQELKERLKEVCRDGAWVEDKGPTIAFHYREVSKDKFEEITQRARQIFNEVGMEIYPSRRALEARPTVMWDKGRASIYILRSLFGVDWSERVSTIFAGDDKTDETAMIALQGMAVTFRITESEDIRTAAMYRLPNTDAVHALLKWLDRHMSARSIPPLCRPRASSMSDNFSPHGSPRLRPKHKTLTNLVLNDTDYKMKGYKMSPPQSPSKPKEFPMSDKSEKDLDDEDD